MTLTEKTAYLKGLAEGLGIEKKDTAEAKLIKALIDLCTDMAEEIEDLGSDIEDLIDYCEELDEDLGDVEQVLIDEEDDEDWECDGDCDCCDMCDDCEDCDCCDCCDDYYEIICPSCGETVCFDESVDAEELICPACGEPIGSIVDEDDIDPVEE